MRFYSYIIGFLLIAPNFLCAQRKCASEDYSSKYFEQWIANKIKETQETGINKPWQSNELKIPVVVHVIHRGEPIGTGANLSEKRIRRQIAILNEDFQRKNKDAVNTPDVFKPVAASMNISFELAKKDPKGNPTNGIIRTKEIRTSYGPTIDNYLVRSISYWSPKNYLNIYLTNLTSGSLGQSSFPETNNIEGIEWQRKHRIFDAVQVDEQYFGENPNSKPFKSYGRTLTHEVGHYFGLLHIWGSCEENDFVADTPPANKNNSQYGSPCTFPHPNRKFCDAQKPEMFQNYMDYTNDECMNLFTKGQEQRINTVLANSPRRVSLKNSHALQASPKLPKNDLAIKRIITPKVYQCESVISPTIEVQNRGGNQIDSYQIEMLINGKSIHQFTKTSASLDSLNSQELVFPSLPLDKKQSGAVVSFRVLEVNGEKDTNTANDQLQVKIGTVGMSKIPFEENFEGNISLSGNFGINQAWEQVVAPTEDNDNKALKFNSYKNETHFGENTLFKTPIFDVVGIESAELTFRYAHAYTEGNFEDGLVIRASKDCGNSFSSSLVFSSFSDDLATVKNINKEFVPSNKLQWKTQTINITSLLSGANNIQFAFKGLNGDGNNIYIDDISIKATNLNENDILVASSKLPIMTCSKNTFFTFKVRNKGVKPISSFELYYDFQARIFKKKYENLNIQSGDYKEFTIILKDLIEGRNTINYKINKVNGETNPSVNQPEQSLTVARSDQNSSLPLRLTFPSDEHDWIPISKDSKLSWEVSEGSLKVNGYKNKLSGTQATFMSPILDKNGLDSVKLSFKYSYAKRDKVNDNLRILLSKDCGITFDTVIFNADADSLAIQQKNTQWTPSNDKDWKNVRLNLTNYFKNKGDNIRIAFVFTNAGGNDLYLDDINLYSVSPPTFKSTMIIYPNPAKSYFKVALNLPQKVPLIQLQLIDVTGKVLLEKYVKDALNQEVLFSTSFESGVYFIKMTGANKNLYTVERVVFTAN